MLILGFQVWEGIKDCGGEGCGELMIKPFKYYHFNTGKMNYN